MLYTRSSRRGWVRDADVHRRWENVGRATGPTIVNGAVRIGVWCGVGHGVNVGGDVCGARSAMVMVVVNGVTSGGVLLEELVDFSRFTRIAIPPEDHSAAYHEDESNNESDYAEDHADGAFVGEEAPVGSSAGGWPGGNDGRLGSSGIR